MADATEAPQEEAKQYACTSCEDSGKVLVNFTGARGGFTKDVPCPDCQGGLRIERGSVTSLQQQEENRQLLTLGLVGAVLVVAVLYLTRNGKPKTETPEPLKEGVLHD